jgi:hypothetical protein
MPFIKLGINKKLRAQEATEFFIGYRAADKKASSMRWFSN